jgi:transposase
VILRLPGLGIQLGARVLAENGDDHTRFADARGLKSFAGSSPVTRASGKKSSITRRSRGTAEKTRTLTPGWSDRAARRSRPW